MENWVKYNLLDRSVKKIMKKNVIPHKFTCQRDRKWAATTSAPRQAFLKRQHLDMVKQAEDNTSICDIEQEKTVLCESVDKIVDQHDDSVTCSNSGSTSRDIAVQANIKPQYRSKYTQAAPINTSKATTPFKVKTVDVSTSPLSYVKTLKRSFPETDDIEVAHASSSSSIDSMKDFESQSFAASETDSSSSYQTDEFKGSSAARSILIIKRNSRHYVGVPDNCYFVVEMLSNTTNICINNILLILKKIRLNASFVELGDDFAISSSQASKVFSKYVSVIAQQLKYFVFWPEPESVIKNLPIAFRKRYSHVQSIIDAFEIEIEKPSDPVKQSLTWSEYKKCNTIKYLISSTPDGIINFISPGFSGRISDTVLVEECGYLQVLPRGASVMADRGFKHLEPLLISMGCSLIRPPSVEQHKKPSKEEVLETKRIASLRIHIERTIRRIREFKLLKPHSCVNNKLLPQMDSVVTIASALVNLQGPLIKK